MRTRIKIVIRGDSIDIRVGTLTKEEVLTQIDRWYKSTGADDPAVIHDAIKKLTEARVPLQAAVDAQNDQPV